MAGNQGGQAGNKTRQAADHFAAGERALAAGDLAGALTGYFRALALAPKHPGYLQSAVALIGVTDGYVLPAVIREILGKAAEDPDFNCQPLHRALRWSLVHDSLGRDFLGLAGRDGDAIEAALAGPQLEPIMKDRLVRAVLQRAVIVSPEIEALVRRLRRHALERRETTCLLGSRLDFFACVAAQAFNTEYAYDLSPDEEAALDALPADTPAQLALIAAYRPLIDVVGDAPPPDVGKSSALAFLFRQQISEPRRERALKQDILALTPVSADLSDKMRAQYEAFPYPRWFGVDQSRPRPFGEVVKERFPDVDVGTLPQGPVDVLIPGCGTGQQVAQVARLFKRARITAVDLSLTSLAYARRKLDGLGIQLHRFGQADILAMRDWDERYDFIECMGVLHHMARPEEGLAVLAGLLKPQGLIRLGLYSARVRAQFDAARKLVADHGLPDTREGVRAARKLIAGLASDDPIREVMESQDFYTISGLHDLIFNVHECSYTPLGLKALLEKAGLEFLGFDHPDPGVTARYRERFPDDPAQTDLTNWEAFEAEFDGTFASMFVFWCRPTADG